MLNTVSVRGDEPWRRRLFLPAYTVNDAARYAKISPNNVKYWHFGGRGLDPALPGREHRRPLSYLELVEVAFVATCNSFRGATTYHRAVFALEKCVRLAQSSSLRLLHEIALH